MGRSDETARKKPREHGEEGQGSRQGSRILQLTGIENSYSDDIDISSSHDVETAAVSEVRQTHEDPEKVQAKQLLKMQNEAIDRMRAEQEKQLQVLQKEQPQKRASRNRAGRQRHGTEILQLTGIDNSYNSYSDDIDISSSHDRETAAVRQTHEDPDKVQAKQLLKMQNEEIDRMRAEQEKRLLLIQKEQPQKRGTSHAAGRQRHGTEILQLTGIDNSYSTDIDISSSHDLETAAVREMRQTHEDPEKVQAKQLLKMQNEEIDRMRAEQEKRLELIQNEQPQKRESSHAADRQRHGTEILHLTGIDTSYSNEIDISSSHDLDSAIIREMRQTHEDPEKVQAKQLLKIQNEEVDRMKAEQQKQLRMLQIEQPGKQASSHIDNRQRATSLNYNQIRRVPGRAVPITGGDPALQKSRGVPATLRRTRPSSLGAISEGGGGSGSSRVLTEGGSGSSRALTSGGSSPQLQPQQQHMVPNGGAQSSQYAPSPVLAEAAERGSTQQSNRLELLKLARSQRPGVPRLNTVGAIPIRGPNYRSRRFQSSRAYGRRNSSAIFPSHASSELLSPQNTTAIPDASEGSSEMIVRAMAVPNDEDYEQYVREQIMNEVVEAEVLDYLYHHPETVDLVSRNSIRLYQTEKSIEELRQSYRRWMLGVVFFFLALLAVVTGGAAYLLNTRCQQ